jgi:hypothetical protein
MPFRLSPLAIALQGIGFSPLLVAAQGLIAIELFEDEMRRRNDGGGRAVAAHKETAHEPDYREDMLQRNRTFVLSFIQMLCTSEILES